MINKELLDYVRQQLASNVSKEVIVNNLKSQGWTNADVYEAFSSVGVSTTSTPIPVSPMASPVTPNVNPTPLQSTQPIANFSNPPHHKSKKIILIVSILILLGLAGGGAYAYYSGFFLSLPKLLSESMDHSRTIKSSSHDVTISVDFSEMKDVASGFNSLSPLGVNSTKLIFTMKGSSDTSDLENIKNSSILSFNLGPFFAEVEFRIIDKILFATLKKAPTLGFLPIPLSVVSSYENKWFSFPFKLEDGQMTNNPLSSISGINANIADKITTEQKERLSQLTKDANFIKTVKKFSPEIITGEMSHHFSFDLDKNGIVSYLQSLDEYFDTISKDNSLLSAVTFDPESLIKELDKLKDFQGEIWIGRSDKLIHKISINFGIQPDETKDEQVKIALVAIFSDYNQPVSIIAPTESISFETLISNIMPNSMGQIQEKGKSE